MILVTCPSAPLLVVIFVDSVHLYCYSIVDDVAFLLVILLTDSFLNIKLVYLALFSLFKLYSIKVPSSIKSLILMCYVSSDELDLWTSK